MKSQLSRLYGQLYAFQGKQTEALTAFAEDVYYCSIEYGTEDARSAVGYYNMGKVLQNQGDYVKAASCNDRVIEIWSAALCRAVLGVVQSQEDGSLESAPPGSAPLPVGRLQLMEVIDMVMDICRTRQVRSRCNCLIISLPDLTHSAPFSMSKMTLGQSHSLVGDACLVCALALIQLEEREKAGEQLDMARSIFTIAASEGTKQKTIGGGILASASKTKLLDMAKVMLSALK